MSVPIPASGQDWNNLFNLASTIALIAMTVVIGAMIYFAVRYRERKGQSKFIPEVGLSRSRARDAVIFAAISIIILVSLTAASYRLTPNARFSSTSSLPIGVDAYQWGFTFTYPNGAHSTDAVYLPENTAVMFNVTSSDVMHNFYLVDFRVSIDAIPGRFNSLYITTPPLDGNPDYNYTIRCKELCGVGHAQMIATMTVTSLAAYNQWLSSQNTTSSSASGG